MLHGVVELLGGLDFEILRVQFLLHEAMEGEALVAEAEFVRL